MMCRLRAGSQEQCLSVQVQCQKSTMELLPHSNGGVGGFQAKPTRNRGTELRNEVKNIEIEKKEQTKIWKMVCAG